MTKVTTDIKYVGVDDTEIDLFEGQYVVPEGVSYNSYICLDKKIAVFDTVDKHKSFEWLKNVEGVLEGRVPDYLIISHMEPDHSSSLVEFVNKYPNVTIVGNEKTFVLIERFFGILTINKLVVKENEELNLGVHTLKFIFAPMVHWPEVMFVYEKTDKVLFSADAFGKFGALGAVDDDWVCEARRYYFNIVGKYGAMVQNVLKKLSGLEIEMICPLHGPVLNENLNYYIDKYNVWSSYEPEEKGVLIAYASIYGNTSKAANFLAAKLESLGENVVLSDLARIDMAAVIEDAFRYDKLVVASVTFDGGLFPVVETFLNQLKSKNYQNRTVAFIENGSWAPMSAKLMRNVFETMKNINFIESSVKINSALTAETEEELIKLAAEIHNN